MDTGIVRAEREVRIELQQLVREPHDLTTACDHQLVTPNLSAKNWVDVRREKTDGQLIK